MSRLPQEPPAQRPRVLLVTELYWPEETSTGHVMTGLAEGLARDVEVGVLAAQPTYSMLGLSAPRRDRRNSVDIKRIRSTRLDKNRAIGRLGNLITVSGALFVAALADLRRGDRVLVVTNPPALPYLVALAARIRRVPYFLIVHDVFPDLLIPAGLARPDSALLRVIRFLARRLYRGAAGIAVCGRDMQSLVRRTMRTPAEDGKVVVVPNWADAEHVRAKPKDKSKLLGDLGIRGAFVVQAAGNLGPLQDIPTLLDAFELLRHRTSIHFLVVGSGAMRPWLEREVETRQLSSVTILDPVRRVDAERIHQACDTALVSLVPGMLGISVPSRSYNFLAAGRPIIAAVDHRSEIGRLVGEYGLGWVVEPGDATALAETIQLAADNRDNVETMGKRARRIAEELLTQERSVKRLAELIMR